MAYPECISRLERSRGIPVGAFRGEVPRFGPQTIYGARLLAQEPVWKFHDGHRLQRKAGTGLLRK